MQRCYNSPKSSSEEFVSPRTAAVEAFSVRRNNKLPGGIAHTIGTYVIETRNLEALIKIRELLILMRALLVPNWQLLDEELDIVAGATKLSHVAHTQISQIIYSELSEGLRQKFESQVKDGTDLVAYGKPNLHLWYEDSWLTRQIELVDVLIRMVEGDLSTAPDVKHIWGVSPPRSSGEGITRRRCKRKRSSRRRKRKRSSCKTRQKKYRR